MSIHPITANGLEEPGAVTWAEILQQPALWLDTQARVRERLSQGWSAGGRVLLTGAGSSYFAAAAIASGWPGSIAIPSTDLLVDLPADLGAGWLVVSLARSGDSPESAAVISRIQKQYPDVRHMVITCNSAGSIAAMPGVEAIVLDPRTNDRSLTMTSSFSNLVLGGLCLSNTARIAPALKAICARSESALDGMDAAAKRIAGKVQGRIAILASAPLLPVAHETSLKILELTGGLVTGMAETFVGLRHGPMSFVHEDTAIVCFLSGEEHRRRYEMDVLVELRSKGLGYLVGIVPGEYDRNLFDDVIPANAPELPDALRSPFEMIFPQMLAYQLAISVGLNPDNPSPTGIINRVVQGVRIYD